MSSVHVRKTTTAAGVVTYRVILRRGGRGSTQLTVASGLTSLREANRIGREAKLAAEEARAGVFKEALTVGQALDAYELHLKGRSDAESVEARARLHLRPALAGIELAELKRARVQALADEKTQAGFSPQTVRHIVGALRAAWELAHRGDLVEGSNPAKGIVLPRVKKRVKHTLNGPELKVVIEELVTPWREAAALAAYLMVRPGELFALQKQDVDMDRRLVTVRRSWDRDQPKDGDERIVPIAELVMPFLERALKRSGASQLVLPAAGGGMMPRTNDTKLARKLRTAMIRAAVKGHESLVTGWTMKCRRVRDGVHCHYEAEAARLEADARCPRCGFALWPAGHARPVRWYDLRHTGASYWIERGVTPVVVSAMLGHHDVELTMRTYVNLSADGLRAEIDRVGRRDLTNAGDAPVSQQTKKGGVS